LSYTASEITEVRPNLHTGNTFFFEKRPLYQPKGLVKKFTPQTPLTELLLDRKVGQLDEWSGSVANRTIKAVLEVKFCHMNKKYTLIKL